MRRCADRSMQLPASLGLVRREVLAAMRAVWPYRATVVRAPSLCEATHGNWYQLRLHTRLHGDSLIAFREKRIPGCYAGLLEQLEDLTSFARRVHARCVCVACDSTGQVRGELFYKTTTCHACGGIGIR